MSDKKAEEKKLKRPTKRRAVNRELMVNRLLEKVLKDLEKSTAQPTLADAIKLLQMQKEFSQEEIREIEVRWVEGYGTDDVSKK